MDKTLRTSQLTISLEIEFYGTDAEFKVMQDELQDEIIELFDSLQCDYPAQFKTDTLAVTSDAET
jgi:hypothetical protein